MKNWQYLTDIQKKENELYHKKTAFGLFIFYLKVQLVISIVTLLGTYNEYVKYYNDSLNIFPTGKFFLINLIPSIFLFFFIMMISKYGKSKTTVKLLITLLISLPLVNTICLLINRTVFGFDPTKEIIGNWLLFMFFGIVFAIYSVFSRPFNLQYLSRIPKD